MVSKPFFHGAAVLVVLATVASAQAARGTANATVGAATLSIEYGAPPWSEARKGQIETGVAVGGVWRLGADTRTTFVVEGGDVAIGDQLIESGGYGLNVRRVGEKAWAFVVFDGSDTMVLPDDNEWQIAAATAEKSDAPPPQLSVVFADAAGKKSLVVRFGPLEIAAPVVALEVSEGDLAIAGEQGGARFISRAAADAPVAGSWMRVGRVSNFYVGELDGSFDVDLKLDGETATLRFQNRDKAKAVAKIARLDAELATAKARAGSSTSPRMRQVVERGEAALKAKQEELAALALAPDPVELPVKLAAAKKASGRLGATLVRRGAKLFAVIDGDTRAAEVEIDDRRIVPSAAGERP
ncbi:MAG: DUF2911 domain-containing protein [Planctomycetes bacterium]|nr:DUF2911 domain-containing protein [Planctomycetota bacterium]